MNDAMALQSKMKAALEKVGLPALEIDCYGSQVTITSKGRDTAEKWAMLLGKFCAKVRAPRESVEYCKKNRGSNLLPSRYTVWRVWGTI
jgi:hypothetical protein